MARSEVYLYDISKKTKEKIRGGRFMLSAPGLLLMSTRRTRAVGRSEEG